MEVCVVGTAINPVPTDVPWSGIESLCQYMVKGFVELGLDVTLVSVQGSLWRGWDKINLIEVPVKGTDIEESFYEGYKDKVKQFKCVIDNSNGKLARMANRHVIQVGHWLQSPFSMGFKNVVCISKAHAQWTKAQYPPSLHKQPQVVYDGVDPERFPFQETKGNEWLFLSVLGPYKGADTALQIALEHPEFKVGFAGRDTSYSDVVKKASEEHSNIKFYGEVSHSRKKDLMGKAKGFLQPAKPFNPHEQFPFMDIFPITLVESNLCGTPILGMANGGVPEMIEDGVNGFLVHDAEEMVKVMRFFEDKIDLIKPIRCREYAVERFSHIKMCQNYLPLIEKVARGEGW